MAGIYRQFAAAYLDFARKVKGIDSKGIDLELIRWLVRKATCLNRMGDAYRDLAAPCCNSTGPATCWRTSEWTFSRTSWT